jgi:Zn-dependent protease with chaperone function
MRTQQKLPTRGLAVLLVLLIAQPNWISAAAPAPELPNPGSVGGITKQQQEQLGLKAMAEVYKQMPVLPDSNPITRYVQSLGKRLQGAIPQQYSWPYQFHVIQQKEINAFALPGGPVFMNIGTITAADNEAELAGVMAHEMSHIYMQHSVKQASKESVAQGILGALGSVLGGGTVGTLARLGIQVGAGTLFLKYSREDEAQADAVGAIIAYKSGYNPKAMADFFQKLEKEGGSRGPQFLSDHPNPGNREEAVQREIQNWPPKNYLGTSPQFASAKQAATNIRAYTAQEIEQGAKQGVWAQQNRKSGATPANLPTAPSDTSGGTGGAGGSGNVVNVSYQQVKPSGNFTQLQNQVFSIAYPDNWQPMSDQNSGGVTIAPPAGVGQGAIAYGVVINGAQDPNGGSLDQSTQQLIQGLQQSNPGLSASGSAQNIKVNGIEGRSINLRGTSPVQQDGRSVSERDWLVTLQRPQGGLLYLVFVAPEDSFRQLRSTYKRMLNSLQIR